MILDYVNDGKDTISFSQEKEYGKWIEDNFSKSFLDEVKLINSTSDTYEVIELLPEIRFEDKPEPVLKIV